MDSNNFPQPERVLVISAHPDDPDFGAAGTVALWTAQGTEVIYVIATDGSKGSSDPEMTGERLVEMRQAEQRAAAAEVGVKDVLFLGYPDGATKNTEELRRDLVRLIRQHKPDLVITHDPTVRIRANNYLNHNDHRAVGDAALDAIFPLARDRLNFPEHEADGLEPHKVLDIFLTFSEEANYWVDISSVMDRKVKALRQHVSQFEDLDELEKYLRERTRKVAQHMSAEYAESFRRVQIN
ncbi:MAG: PIG-L family deacetylase [Chloroflexi bacterium]|nr:MAG: PIG-L family deacetylase [Chloroflexota bacterium]MBL1194539.1 PIG-L family deacetylase [Chloroflexota bacterium]NOH11827.1 PIG-L family deacetylase [Chloroflexota bacterium]